MGRMMVRKSCAVVSLTPVAVGRLDTGGLRPTGNRLPDRVSSWTRQGPGPWPLPILWKSRTASRGQVSCVNLRCTGAAKHPKWSPGCVEVRSTGQQGQGLHPSLFDHVPTDRTHGNRRIETNLAMRGSGGHVKHPACSLQV